MGRGSQKCLPNCTCGRHSPAARSEESRQRISAIMKSIHADPDSVYNSDETRLKTSLSMTQVWADPESVFNSDGWKQKQSESHQGYFKGEPTTGCLSEGYQLLNGYREHPLAVQSYVAEHRLVLWEKLGCETLNCEHVCHWNCGKVLTWSDGRLGIQADHLDGDKLNNVSENLVVSCLRCNVDRGRAGNPVDWSYVQYNFQL